MAEFPIGIYIHVPYCRVVCPYCDFVKKAAEGDAPAAFVAALCREIAGYEGPDTAGSVFFGGGTPSLLAPEDFARVMAAVRRRFDLRDPEVSVEVNPDDVTEDRVQGWLDEGVTRINVGVQSFDDVTLTFLGRCHDAACARRACDLVAGRFPVWGVDLIFGAEPLAAWSDSLRVTETMAPPHVSTYCLTYEENTPFWRRRAEAADDDTTLAQYREAMEVLAAYDHYEVSNFARPRAHCRHNRIYWRNEAYAGLGPGAYSFIDGVRMRNEPRIDRYLRAPGEKAEALPLSPREVRVETLIQHFRTRAGLQTAYYRDRFGEDVETEFGAELGKLCNRGLLEWANGAIRPTRLGYELNNEIGLALVD